MGYSTLFPFFPDWLEDDNLPEYSFPLLRNWTAQEFYSEFILLVYHTVRGQNPSNMATYMKLPVSRRRSYQSTPILTVTDLAG